MTGRYLMLRIYLYLRGTLQCLLFQLTKNCDIFNSKLAYLHYALIIPLMADFNPLVVSTNLKYTLWTTGIRST